MPLIGAVLVACIPAAKKTLARRCALLFSFAALALAAFLTAGFNPAGGMQYQEHHSWVAAIGAEYRLGLDGLGMVMVLLTSIVIPFSLLLLPPEDDGANSYHALFLFLQSGLFGAFTALNFFHWFFFWELSLIPAFFLIKLWGGGGRGPAATQFFVYTMAGSVAMLLAFLALFLATQSMDFLTLAELGRDGKLAAALSQKLGWHSPETAVFVVFCGVLFGLAVKVPMFPFHTWLPSAYSEAPTGTTMVLTGVMSKMGVYGFLRILMPIFPDQMRAAMVPLVLLALLSIILPAWAAFAQKDLKRMIAYSSVNHLGYCLLGIFAAMKATGGEPRWELEKAAAIDGVVLQMFNHGLSASALFCFIGLLERRSGGLRGLDDFGGLRKSMPVFCGLMGVALFSSLGLPGLNGFVGEFLIFKGVFALNAWAAALAALGLLITAIFLLTLIQKVFTGPLNGRWKDMPDLSVRERMVFAPIVALMFAIGICPQIIIGIINPMVAQMAAQMSK
jgi:NADH-quinone oxidoreductase subunit M